jgi:hypothetical protein
VVPVGLVILFCVAVAARFQNLELQEGENGKVTPIRHQRVETVSQESTFVPKMEQTSFFLFSSRT